MTCGAGPPPEPLPGEATLLTGKCFAARLDRQRALDIFSALSDTRADEVGARATVERARALESTGNLTEAVNQYLRIAYIFPGFSELAAEGMFNAARLASQAGDEAMRPASAGSFESATPTAHGSSAWTKARRRGAPSTRMYGRSAVRGAPRTRIRRKARPWSETGRRTGHSATCVPR